MSNVGLNSNIYHISNKYLEKMNDFLVEANFNPEAISKERVDDVYQVIQKLSDKESQNFQIQMVLLILDSYFQSKKKNVEKILEELISLFEKGDFNKSKAIKNIELIAGALDQECDFAFSRIQGK